MMKIGRFSHAVCVTFRGSKLSFCLSFAASFYSVILCAGQFFKCWGHIFNLRSQKLDFQLLLRAEQCWGSLAGQKSELIPCISTYFGTLNQQKIIKLDIFVYYVRKYGDLMEGQLTKTWENHFIKLEIFIFLQFCVLSKLIMWL